jgi:uncharacterized protein (DUF58 family)
VNVARAAGTVGRAVRKAVPLTARGLALVIIAAVALLVGVLRTDLAALFWGASFLLFAVFALIAGHLFRAVLRRRGRRTVEFLSVILPSAGVFAGEQAEALVSADLPRRFPPGFAARVSLPLAWHDRRIDTVGLRLSHGKSQGRVAFTAEHRGTYASSDAVLEARDILGFTRHRLLVPLRERLTVFPRLQGDEALSPFMEQADESSADARRRRRSEELLEARKYYPGDDMRRLNWKVFAHLNELFLRIGEEVPPPESRILVVLDCTTNPLLPSAAAAGYLDTLVSSCASLMAALIDKRIEVMLSLPGVRECRAYAEESRPMLLAALADAWWTDAPWAPDLPGRKSLHVAVFSSPGSPGLRPILALVQRHGWSASLFIKRLEPTPPPQPLRLRELLFLPPRYPPRYGLRAERVLPYSADLSGDLSADLHRNLRPPTVPLGKRERQALQEALSRDLAAYRGPSAGLVKHAAAI